MGFAPGGASFLNEEFIKELHEILPDVPESALHHILDATSFVLTEKLRRGEVINIDRLTAIKRKPERRHSAKFRKWYDSLHTLLHISPYYQVTSGPITQYCFELQWNPDYKTTSTRNKEKLHEWCKAWLLWIKLTKEFKPWSKELPIDGEENKFLAGKSGGFLTEKDIEYIRSTYPGKRKRVDK